MSRLIDADALIEFCAERWIPLNIDAVNMQPTIQPVATDTNVGDTISRQATIDAVNNAFDRETLLTGFVRSIAVRAIRDMPSVQPERKKGEWIEISSINHTYKCSECGRLLVNITDGRNNVSKHYPYCHCGADMRGERQK